MLAVVNYLYIVLECASDAGSKKNYHSLICPRPSFCPHSSHGGVTSLSCRLSSLL